MRKISELKEKIRQKTIKFKTNSPFEYLYRYLSAIIVRRIVNTKITPNQVTIFRCIMMLFILYQFYLQKYINLLVGVVGLFFWDLLDCVDGDLATLRGNVTKFGEFLEIFLERPLGKLAGLFGFAIACGIYHQTKDIKIWIVLFFLMMGDYLTTIFGNFRMKMKLEVAVKGEDSGKQGKEVFKKLAKVIREVTYYELQVTAIFALLYYPFGKFFHLNSLYLNLIFFALLKNLLWLSRGVMTLMDLKGK